MYVRFTWDSQVYSHLNCMEYMKTKKYTFLKPSWDSHIPTLIEYRSPKNKKKYKFLNFTFDSQVYSHLNRVWNLSKIKILVRKTHMRFSHSHVNRVRKSTKVKKHYFLNTTWESEVYSLLKRVWNLSIVKIQFCEHDLTSSGVFSSELYTEFMKTKNNIS